VAGEELMDVVHNSKRRLGAGRSRNKAACSDQDGLLRIAVDQGRSDRRDWSTAIWAKSQAAKEIEFLVQASSSERAAGWKLPNVIFLSESRQASRPKLPTAPIVSFPFLGALRRKAAVLEK